MEKPISAKAFIASEGNRYNAAVSAVIAAGLGHRPMSPEVKKLTVGALAKLHAAELVAACNPADAPLNPLIKEDLSTAVDAAIAATEEWRIATSN